MKVIYDKATDTLTVIFREAAIAESDEEKPGIVLDYDHDGQIVSMEILDASQKVKDPERVEFSRVA